MPYTSEESWQGRGCAYQLLSHHPMKRSYPDGKKEQGFLNKLQTNKLRFYDKQYFCKN